MSATRTRRAIAVALAALAVAAGSASDAAAYVTPGTVHVYVRGRCASSWTYGPADYVTGLSVWTPQKGYRYWPASSGLGGYSANFDYGSLYKGWGDTYINWTVNCRYGGPRNGQTRYGSAFQSTFWLSFG
jgi:hypothetical protein